MYTLANQPVQDKTIKQDPAKTQTSLDIRLSAPTGQNLHAALNSIALRTAKTVLSAIGLMGCHEL